MISSDESDLRDDGQEEKPSIWKKVYVAIIASLLLALMIPYFTIGPVYSEIHGQLTSQQPSNNQLVFQDVTLTFQGETTAYLANLYTQNQALKAVETAACLKGTKVNNNYIVNTIYEPEILQQQFNHVQFTSCPEDTLVMLHTHPELNCEASQTDLNTLEKRKRSTPDILMIIMCAPDRYVLYR